jgi:hypothetical protein
MMVQIAHGKFTEAPSSDSYHQADIYRRRDPLNLPLKEPNRAQASFWKVYGAVTCQIYSRFSMP